MTLIFRELVYLSGHSGRVMELASGFSEGAESLYSLLTCSLPPIRV